MTPPFLFPSLHMSFPSPTSGSTGPPPRSVFAISRAHAVALSRVRAHTPNFACFRLTIHAPVDPSLPSTAHHHALFFFLDQARQAKVVKAAIKGTKAESREQVKHAAAERRGRKKRPRKGRAAQKHAQKHEQQEQTATTPPTSTPSSVAAVAKADYKL